MAKSYKVAGKTYRPHEHNSYKKLKLFKNRTSTTTTWERKFTHPFPKKKEKRKKNGELKEVLCNFNNNVLSSTICMMILNYSLFYSLILHIFRLLVCSFPILLYITLGKEPNTLWSICQRTALLSTLLSLF